MMSKDKIDRINYLANKSEKNGLTEEEKQEQKKLRNEYLRNIRKSFTNQLSSITVVDPEGTDVTPKKVKQLKKKK